ncbi:HlyD family efflux transporter periplasmic adaptor subunit [Planosporangium thailandense]|uniref:HlyD family efflux transporter periplasmic adaptor subunit n=1 Tax=Planosporangium thailandense TaxID=765197 RepID=A0ABX0XSQ9_9ACTN|nr:efflux RND transporter periplasmic adaptor subunit [Planosporangium thailandense]NJC69046.1 HlyD family efflux transporter periplasmic adaptor subunit [Planosporangium thailandense]
MSRSAMAMNSVLAALLLVGVLLAYRTVAAGAAAADSAAAGASMVTRGPVVATVSASGTVQSSATANLNFAAAGTVTEIDVKVGDEVKRDQVLARINDPHAQEKLSTAQASLASAQKSLSRVLDSTSNASTIALAQAQVTSAQNNVDTAQRAVNATTLTAPMDATVVSINGTVGTWWNPGGLDTGSPAGEPDAAAQPGGAGFIQLADLAHLQVSTSFPEADAMKIKSDQPVTVTWAALSGTSVAGRVTVVAPAATYQNNLSSYPVTVQLQWLPDGVRIGQTVTVKVAVAAVDDVVRVPADAIRPAGSRQTVEVVDSDGIRHARTVQTGLEGDEYVEIRSGLRPGELVAADRGGTRGNR